MLPRFALTVAPALEPVSVAEAKAHCRVEIDADDALFSSMITRARRQVEDLTGRALVEQTWTATLDRWADEWDAADPFPFYTSPTQRRIRLKPAPVASITSVVVDGVTISAGAYALRGNELWVKPEVVDSTNELGGGIVVTFKAGFGAAATDVPEQLKLAILMLVAHFYENREATSPAGIYHQVTPFGFESLLTPFRVLEL